MATPWPTRDHLRACVQADWVWQRILGSKRLGNPAQVGEAGALGRIQWLVIGNGSRCGRYRCRLRGNRIGCWLPEAHADNGMASALEALGPPVVTIGINGRNSG